jgi:hypothetical protein
MDDELLVRYLVGTTTDEETESLDQLSIADEAFAVRLRAVEHDLVDAYASGGLSGGVLDHFTSHYLSSPSGRAKVEIAKALRVYRGTDAAPHAKPAVRSIGASRKWLLAAAAALIAIGATLAVDNVRLRQRAADARQGQLALEQRERELQDTIGRQQSAIADAARERAHAREEATERESQPAAGKYVLSIVLFPATRDAQRVPAIALSKSVDAVTLAVDPGPEQFAEYRAVLEDAASDRVVWRSGPLRVASVQGRRIFATTVRASLLHGGEYALKLSGITATREAKALDTYPFRVVLE